MPNETDTKQPETNDYTKLRLELINLDPPMSRDTASVVAAILMVEERLSDMIEFVKEERIDTSDLDMGSPPTTPASEG